MTESIPIPNEFDDANDFWPHPIYDRWESNRLGVVRHIVNKEDVGNLEKSGYFRMLVSDNGKRKHYLKHRFIYECFHGPITNVKLVVDHINNIKTDNRLDNLQIISQSENQLKENIKGEKRSHISVRATNLDTGLSTDYYSINDCARNLGIRHVSVRRVLDGVIKTTTSKLDKNKYVFEKIEKLEYKQKGKNRLPIRVRAINIDTNKTSDYDSINTCSNSLDIDRSAIRKIINGINKTSTSKKDKSLYTFEKIN